jgi:hypothetical protein
MRNLENLSIQPQPLQGQELVAISNGAGLGIENTGLAILYSPKFPFHLHIILHCPTAPTNLLSIHKFCLDNNCFFILTLSHFFLNDLQTHAILLEGKSENGLYPLCFRRWSSKNNNPTFTVFFFWLKTSISIWHFRLSHFSIPTVNHVIKAHNLPISNISFNKD